MNIDNIIKELIKESNISQSELTTKLFLNQDTVLLWKLNKSLPDMHSLIKLGKIFNVTSYYLLGLEN